MFFGSSDKNKFNYYEFIKLFIKLASNNNLPIINTKCVHIYIYIYICIYVHIQQ
jgi:hypothetical protein